MKPHLTACFFSLALASVLLASTANAQDEEETSLPAAAARRMTLVEPLSFAPSPWPALCAAFDGGVRVDGKLGWSALRVHVPVARRYGAVDFRLQGVFGEEGFVSLDPEIWLRGIPLRFRDEQIALGFALGFEPYMEDGDPRIVIAGGLMGGFVGRLWFLRAFVGARGEVLAPDGAEVMGQLALGLRLPYGIRPQVEIDIAGEAQRRGDITMIVRPALRYWPAGWIGIGVRADVAVLPETEAAVGIDVVLHARE